MIKLKEYTPNSHSYFALQLMTDSEDEGSKPNLLNVSLFRHSWWFQIPRIIKTKSKWIDLSKESWAHERPDGVKGYTEHIQRSYGFTFTEDSVHVCYGIQPGCWSSSDPKNSDHSKVFWYPWSKTIVRYDLLYPNGDVYYRNIYPRKNNKHLHWYEVFISKPNTNVPQCELAKFVELTHTTSDGRVQKAKIRLTGEEREWRPKWTRRLPMFKFVRRVVDCDSNIELGEKAGSWKGGLMGWSCEWNHNETMEQAFWRWYKNWNGV